MASGLKAIILFFIFFLFLVFHANLKQRGRPTLLDPILDNQATMSQDNTFNLSPWSAECSNQFGDRTTLTIKAA